MKAPGTISGSPDRFSASLCLAALLVAWFALAPAGAEELVVYSIAAAKPTMKKINAAFQEAARAEVAANYVGCFATVSQQLQAGNEVDIFIPGSMQIALAMEKEGLVSRVVPFANNKTCLAVTKGTKVVRSFDQLTRPGVRIAFGNFRVTPIGKYTRQILDKAGIFGKVRRNIVTQGLCIEMLMTYVEKGNADVTLVWEKDARASSGVEIIEIPEEYTVFETIPICVIKSTKKPELAKKYMDFFLTRGLEMFRADHYDMVAGAEAAAGAGPEPGASSKAVGAPAQGAR